MDEARMSFRDHLVELRLRLLRAVAAVLLCALAAFFIADDLYRLLAAPMLRALPEGSQLIVTGPIEYFLVVLKLSVVAGVFLASPWVLYQLWAFIAPGLYQHERRYAAAFVVSGSLFFVGGAAFCYGVVFPLGLPLLISLNPPDVIGMYRVGEYYSFAIQLLLAFGIAFEMPVVVVLLCLLGVVEPAQLGRFRKYALVLSFVVGAILTPPDALSQAAMAVPLYLLYEGGLLVARVLVQRRATTTPAAATTATAPGPPLAG